MLRDESGSSNVHQCPGLMGRAAESRAQRIGPRERTVCFEVEYQGVEGQDSSQTTCYDNKMPAVYLDLGSMEDFSS